jgi:hypothetical protein
VNKSLYTVEEVSRLSDSDRRRRSGLRPGVPRIPRQYTRWPFRDLIPLHLYVQLHEALYVYMQQIKVAMTMSRRKERVFDPLISSHGGLFVVIGRSLDRELDVIWP